MSHLAREFGLVEFEWQLLEAMVGERPAFEWGGWVGAALEVLKGRRLVELVWEGSPLVLTYRVTELGKQALDVRKQENWTHCPVCKERVTESEWHGHMKRHEP